VKERRNEFSGTPKVFSWAEALSVESEYFSADSVRVTAERFAADYRIHIAADHGRPKRNREVPIKKRSRTGTTSIPFPQKARIKQRFVSGKNISQIAREEKRHWTTVAKIVEEKDVQEYVKDLRAKFYGALEDVRIAVIQYVKHGKDGGLLGYRMLLDAGVIPQKDGKRRPAMEPQKPADAQPDSEQHRIRMIATEMVRRGMERQRFFAEPLEMEETEEEVRRNR
jgi:hypothetical protein